jgi:hypothetical protein
VRRERRGAQRETDGSQERPGSDPHGLVLSLRSGSGCFAPHTASKREQAARPKRR